MKPLTQNDLVLNHFDVEAFLTNHWQKSPCLIKNALPAPNYVSADELAGFSLEEEVESRIISNHNNQWQLHHGPFEEAFFSQLPESHWTLLVQTLDYWLPEINQLLQYFNFIPRWRFDDVMVSYASHAGGVGPHYDNYDVFLIQAEGQRRWRVGQKGDLGKQKTLLSGLKHLDNFNHPMIDAVMQPGDILYVPPDTAHWGESIGESIGYSVGYRSPQTKDIFALLANHLDSSQLDFSKNTPLNQFFADTYRKSSNNTNQIEPELIQWAQEEVHKIANNQKLIASLLSKSLSENKIDSPVSKVDYQLEDNTTITSKIQSIVLASGVNANWYILDQQLYLTLEGEQLQLDIRSKPLIIDLLANNKVNPQTYQAHQQTFDFSETLAKLVSIGYFLIE